MKTSTPPPRCSKRRVRYKRCCQLEPLERRMVLDSTVVFNEIMYHGDGDDQQLEWVELYNQMSLNMDLSGWRIEGGVTYEFAAGTTIAGRSLLVIASDPQFLESETGFSRALGPFIGRLSNGGEELRLLNNDDRLMNVVDYRDSGDWPDGPDGSGFSLAKQQEMVASHLPENWTTSGERGGTPGAANFLPPGETTTEILIDHGDAARVLVPTDGGLGLGWTETAFDDNAWTVGPTAIGFEVGNVSQVAYGNLVGAGGSSPFSGPLGHDFVVNSSITVTHLGVFDSDADGLSRTLTAEVWTRNGNSGTLVSQLQFTSGDSGTLLDSNRFKPLTTPLLLTPGDYTIVAHGYGSGEPAGNQAFGGPGQAFKTLNDDGGNISFVGSSRLGTTPGTFPATTQGGGSVNHFSAGTFEFKVGGALNFATNIESEMHDVNSTAYIRIPFSVADVAMVRSLTLDMEYNDGFVAYINGQEAARRNAPTSVDWNSAATAPVTDLAEEQISLAAHLSALETGANVLAIHGLNDAVNDAQFRILPQLSVLTGPPDDRPLRLNEVGPGETAGFFVEITNDSGLAQPVDGLLIATSAGNEYVIPSQTIAAGGHLSVAEAELGFTPAVGENLFLFTDGRTGLLDARHVTDRLRGRSPEHDGRWLFPAAATSGGDNSFNFHDDIVIDEIMFHPFGEVSNSNDDLPPMSTTSTLVPTGAEASYFVPSDDTLAATWQLLGFDDSVWTTGPTSIGYDIVGASQVAYGNLLGAGGTSPFSGPLGHDFVANSEITVTHLGVFDSDADGLSRTLTAEIWARDGNSGTRLTQLVFTSADPGTLVDSNRLKPLATSLALEPGDYTIVAHGYGSGERAGNQAFGGPGQAFKTLNDGGGSISFVGSSRLGTTPGTFPATAQGGGSANHYSAGTFQFNAAATVLPLVATDVQSALHEVNSTIYTRVEFNAPALSDAESALLVLKMKYDDGFVAHLNGVEVARRNAPAAPSWNSAATSPGQVLSDFETIDISAHADELLAGPNVLAIQGLNISAADNDFLVLPELQLTTASLPDNDWLELYNRGAAAVDLTGWKIDGGIDYNFEPGTMIAPDGYLVVAKNAQQLAASYPGIDVVGNFSGRLSNSTERIVLRDNHQNPADEVEYFDGGRWPQQADGGGSSLELRDPSADNSKAEAWAASDVSRYSNWNSYSVRHVAATDVGPTIWNEFVLGLLDTGQFLIDDVSVRRDPEGANVEHIQNGSFESDTIGGEAAKWRIIGNHQGTVIDDPDIPGANKVLHVVADAHTRHQHDHGETTFVGNMSVINGAEYEISFRAKWLGGSPLLNARLYFTRVADTIALQTPERSGTPGTANSTLEANIGPTYSGFSHAPVVPSSQEPVTVQVEAQHPDSVGSMTLFWSAGGGGFTSAAMSPLSGGRYQGTIPGHSTGTVVQFYVEGEDVLGATSTFPAAGAESRALYRVNTGQGAGFAIDRIQLIMLPGDVSNSSSDANLMGNQFYGASLTVNGQEAFYDVAARRKGAFFHGRTRGYRVNFRPDQLFRGVHDRIALDGTGSHNLLRGSQDEILANQLISHAGGIVSIYDDLAYIIAPNGSDSGPIILQLARYDSVYLDEQFANGSNSPLYEFEGIGYSTATINGQPEGLKNTRARGHINCCDLADFGDSKERYRWRFEKKNDRDQDNFDRIIAMNKAFDLSGEALQTALNEILDVDQWMRTFAMMSLLGVLDLYSVVSTQNIMFYVRPEDNKVLVFPWDWDQSWNRPVNSPLHGTAHANMTKVLDLPANERLHLGNLHDLINTTFNRTYATPWAQHLGSLVGQNFGAHPGYIEDRGNYVLSQFPAQIPFQITTPGPLNVGAASTAMIEGKGWINVREIRLSGSNQALDLSWSVGSGSSFADTWEVTVPVTSGTNPVSLEAYDYQGALIGSVSINVTSSTPNPVAESLRITEINYNPSEPTAAELSQDPQLNDSKFAYLEFQNIGAQTINLLGTSFTEGIEFTFPNIQLSPGQRGVVVRDQAAFQVRYDSGLNVLGEFTNGGLSNAGERLTLVDGQLQTVLDFSYDDSNPWPERADGAGGSLELIDPVGTPVAEFGKYYRWRGSTAFGGTPAAAGADPPGVVINEVLAHTDPPVTQSDSIELHNPTSGAIDISGWWLSDSDANLLKYQIPNSTTLNPGGYIVFDESHFNPTPFTPRPNDFALSGASGEGVYLVVSDGSGGVQSFGDDVHFGASPNGESFGRAPNGNGRLQPMKTTTLASTNAGPRVGPLVISEVNYHPADPSAAALAIEPALTDNDLEFIEVLNPTAQQVDLTNWRIRGGVDFDFTTGTTIDAGSTLVVVSFDSHSPGNANRVIAFRTHYGLGAEVVLVGGYQNQLSNGSGRVQLQRPDAPPLEQPTLVPRLLEDEVLYDDQAPWSTAADGLGMSLHRTDTGSAGNDAANWTARTPNPGQPDRLGDADLDGDVDTSDLTTGIINFTGAGGAEKTWSDGDTDGDGDVDTGDLTTAIINFTGAAANTGVSLTLCVIVSADTSAAEVREDSAIGVNVTAVSDDETHVASERKPTVRSRPRISPHLPQGNLRARSKTEQVDIVLENWVDWRRKIRI